MAKYTDFTRPLHKGKYTGYVEGAAFNEAAINKRARERGIDVGEDPAKPLMRSAGQGVGLLPSGELETFGDTGKYDMSAEEIDALLDRAIASKTKAGRYSGKGLAYSVGPEPPSAAGERLRAQGRAVDIDFPDVPIGMDIEDYQLEESYKFASTIALNEYLDAAKPLGMLPPDSPQYIVANASVEAAYQQKMAKINSDYQRLQQQFEILDRLNTLNPEETRLGKAQQLSKTKSFQFKAPKLPKVPTPMDMAKESAKLAVAINKMKGTTDETTPQYRVLGDRLNSLQAQMAETTGQVYVKIERKVRWGSAVNKGIEGWMLPEKAANEYKIRNMDVPVALKSYDIGKTDKDKRAELIRRGWTNEQINNALKGK